MQWRSEGAERANPRAAVRRRRQKWGDIRDIRYLTTFGGGKIAVRPGRR